MRTVTKAVIGLSAAGAAGAAYILIQKGRNEVSVEAANRVDNHEAEELTLERRGAGL